MVVDTVAFTPRHGAQLARLAGRVGSLIVISTGAVYSDPGLPVPITEDWPTVKSYDEAAWANLSDSRWLPVDVSLTMLEALHGRWVGLLESLSDENFQKGYEHSDMGRQNLAKVLALYDWHSRHHTAHITSLRARQGW